MKIIHVINSMSTSHGGPTRTALLTMQGTRSLGMDVEIVTNQPAPGEEAVSDDPSIRYLPRLGFHDKRWGYSKAISRELTKIGNVDIYHIHMVVFGIYYGPVCLEAGMPLPDYSSRNAVSGGAGTIFPDKKDGYEFVSAPAVATGCLYPCYLPGRDGALPGTGVY